MALANLPQTAPVPPSGEEPPIAENRRWTTAQTRGVATPQDQRDARANRGKGLADPRRVSVGLLYVEARRYVALRAKGVKRTERESLAAEMVLRIGERITEETRGDASTPWRNRPPIKRGRIMRWSDVGFLLRMDDGRALVSADGRRILSAALKASIDAPRLWRETAPELTMAGEPVEMLTDPHAPTFGELAVELDDPDAARTVDASAEEIARILSLPLTAARVLEGALSFGRLNLRTNVFTINRARCARHWGVSDANAKSILRDGKRMLRARFPSPAALLGALDTAASALVEIAADACAEALEEMRADWLRVSTSGAHLGAVVLGEWVPIESGRVATFAARRYQGALAESEADAARHLAACARNCSKVIERTPWDAIPGYRRDALMMGALAYWARVSRVRRHAATLQLVRSVGALDRASLPDMRGMAERERERRAKARAVMARAVVMLEEKSRRIAGDDYPVELGAVERLIQDAYRAMRRIDSAPIDRVERVAQSWETIARGSVNAYPVAECHCRGCHDKRALLARMRG